MQNIFLHIKKLEQLAFWLFMWFFLFDYYFLANNWGEAIVNTSLEISTYALIVYLNLLLLIPAFLKRKKKFLYIFSVIVMITGYILLLHITGLEKHFYEYTGWRNVFSMVLNTSLFLLVSLLYWYFKQWQIERERQLVLRSEKLEAELNFLRSQISPHFIFNTLNNIYSLILQKHENAAPMVSKLSSLLRYILYEGSSGEVFLNKEIETLQKYIELNLLRKPRSQNVIFTTKGTFGNLKISPMLLINFAENCFKHSNIDNDENAFINIVCEIDDAEKFSFNLENSCRLLSTEKEIGGIGLQNATRQLQLNYPNAYTLDMYKKENIYTVKLNLQLKKA